MELRGVIKKIGDLQDFPSGFQKRELVLLTEEQYPQPINIEFLSDKIDLLDSVSEGENVKVGINIRGREWTSPQGEVKYFNSITGWKIDKVKRENDNHTAKPYNETPKTESSKSPENPLVEDEDDDLPF